VITGALEVERATKRIGSSLQAHPRIWADASYREAAANLDIAELAITSAASFAEGVPPDNAFRLPEFPGVAVEVQLAQGEKCDRCWQVLPEVGRALAHPTLCGRCVEAVELHRAAAE
jgi:isoleucyl-tRNA synthetase